MSAISLDKLLKSGAAESLNEVVSKARDMGELTHILQEVLEDDLASALKAANARDDGELVLICESSAWAARLRYESERLLKAARDAGRAVTTCRVIIGRDQ